MNKVIVCVVSLLVGLGLGYVIPHGATTPERAGGIRITADHFVGGLYAGEADELSIDGDGDISTSGTVTFSGTNTLSGATTVSGAFTVSNSGNTGVVVTPASGTATTTVKSGAVCVANLISATSTISTYASTTGTTLTIKGAPSQAFQYICF
jgi:hypothetical protein